MWDRLYNRLAEMQRESKMPHTPKSAHRRIAVCGHTNVGKSSFVNSLVAHEISVVRSKEASALPIMIRDGPCEKWQLRRNGKTIELDESLSKLHTVDDAIDPAWSGFVFQIPRPFLTHYQLIDTPGIGGSIQPGPVYSVVERCDFALTLFNKPDANMLAPIKHLASRPVCAVRTQADDDMIDEAEYDEERCQTQRALEKLTDGFPIPFIYTTVLADALPFGAVYVPDLALRLSIVFQYGEIASGTHALLDAIARKEATMIRAAQALSVSEASMIYSAWESVKSFLDKIKLRRDKALTPTDAEYLEIIIRKPVGHAVWKRVLEHYGPAPVHVGQDPNKQYRVIDAWFDEFDKRVKLDRKLDFLSELKKRMTRDGRLLLTLAAALLSRELGDARSAAVLVRRFEELAGEQLANWKPLAPEFWETIHG